MPLGDADIERFARHIVVPGVGAAGQERISSSALAVLATPESEPHVLAYARAAGFRITHAGDPALACAIAADAGRLAAGDRDSIRALRCPIVWYTLDGARLRSGVTTAGDLPSVARDAEAAPDPALHAAAAADAVAAAIAVVLGWNDVETRSEIDLG